MVSADAINRLSLGNVRCVREVLLQKSVSLAAERLGISQPAVSQHVARFEKFTGIPILSRNGNAVNICSDELAKLVFAMVEAQDDLIRLAQDQPLKIPRLGISDCLGTFYCRNDSNYAALSDGYALHVAKPTVLMELFQRGELDILVRPLFHQEPDTELVTTVPIDWISPLPSCEDGPNSNKAVNVVLESTMSPYSYYADRQLEKLPIRHNVIARVDDHMVRLQLVAAKRIHVTIPAFLACALPDSTCASNLFERKATVRLGVFFTNRKVSYSAALALFDMITGHLAPATGAVLRRPPERLPA